MQRPLQILLIISAMLTSMATDTHAQAADSTHTAINNRMVQNIIAQDSLRTDSIYKKQIERNAELSADSSRVSMKRTSTLPESTKPRFIPDPQKATWLAVVFPGAGQIPHGWPWYFPEPDRYTTANIGSSPSYMADSSAAYTHSIGTVKCIATTVKPFST